MIYYIMIVRVVLHKFIRMIYYRKIVRVRLNSVEVNTKIMFLLHLYSTCTILCCCVVLRFITFIHGTIRKFHLKYALRH